MHSYTPGPSMPQDFMINEYVSDLLKLIDESKNPKKAQHEYELGLAYEQGLNELNERPDLALAWYQKAAKHGHAEAQYKLALIYSPFEALYPGVQKDAYLCARWYEKAAKQGIPEAQYNFAVMCEQGAPGLEKDLECAIRYYGMASRRGLAAASYNLGCIYKNRAGVFLEEPGHSIQEAIYYFKQAAKQGDEDASSKIEQIYLEFPEQRPEAPKPKIVAPAAPEGFKRDRRRVQSIVSMSNGDLKLVGECKKDASATTLTPAFDRRRRLSLNDATISSAPPITPTSDTHCVSKAHPLLQEALPEENKQENIPPARRRVPLFKT